jgi:hypothetical protein
MLNRNKLVSLHVLTEVNTAFWDVTLRSLAEVYERFGGTCCLWKDQSPTKVHNFGQNIRHIRQKQPSISIWTRHKLQLFLFRPQTLFSKNPHPPPTNNNL